MADKLFDDSSPAMVAMSNLFVEELKKRWGCPKEKDLDDWIEELKGLQTKVDDHPKLKPLQAWHTLKKHPLRLKAKDACLFYIGEYSSISNEWGMKAQNIFDLWLVFDMDRYRNALPRHDVEIIEYKAAMVFLEEFFSIVNDFEEER